MAGTVERIEVAEADRRAVAEMEASAKEQAEHRLVVEAVLASLEPVCDEVSASAQPEVARLTTVAHLATTVAGRLRAPAPTALALAARLHPTPAVAGTPLPAALAAIAELEGFDRGSYAGPVGWVDARGDGDWAVAVRCATVDGRRARLVAGAGIVAGSRPDGEWAETSVKLDPMLRALVRP
jgi:menaquinone-specific isochorismate synthase